MISPLLTRPRPKTKHSDPLSILNGRSKRIEGYSYKLAFGPTSQYGIDVVLPENLDIDEKNMSVWIPIADGNRRDGVGDLLDVNGIDTSRHQRNPIVLFDHGKQVPLPIALAQDPNGMYTMQIDSVSRMAGLRAFFYQNKGLGGNGTITNAQQYEHSLFCEQLFDLVCRGFIRAGSIGYQIKHAKPLQPDFERGTPQGLHLLSILMLEGSLVVLPANGDTVRKVLDMNKVCGKRLSQYLVKSLTPYIGSEQGDSRKFQVEIQNPKKKQLPKEPEIRKIPGTAVKELRRKYRFKRMSRTRKKNMPLHVFEVGCKHNGKSAKFEVKARNLDEATKIAYEGSAKAVGMPSSSVKRVKLIRPCKDI